jgi:hypothetical protein
MVLESVGRCRSYRRLESATYQRYRELLIMPNLAVLILDWCILLRCFYLFLINCVRTVLYPIDCSLSFTSREISNLVLIRDIRNHVSKHSLFFSFEMFI